MSALPATQAELVFWAARQHGDRPAVRYQRGGQWHERSYVELAGLVAEYGAGLIGLGVQPGDRVALLAETRPEWTYVELAIAAVGAVCVPVYPTNTAQECAWVLGDSEARLVVCENAVHVARVAGVRDRLPLLETVLVIDADGVDPGSVVSLEALTASEVDPDEVRRRAAAVTPQDISTIVYTSGTTGPPKGCVLSYTNWNALLAMPRGRLELDNQDVVYLYLPLAHLLARIVQAIVLEHGGAVCYYGGDIRRVVSELAEVRPTFLPSVPRMFEKVHSQLMTMLRAAAPEDQAKAEQAIELGGRVRRLREGGEPVSAADQEAFAAADSRLYSVVRGVFGGQLKWALSGGAPIAPQILEFFYACGVPVYEGYGMTESIGLAAINLPGAVRLGTVGRPVPGMQVRIENDGEILLRGDGVFLGYHGNPEATAEVLVDGWLHTGDLGSFDDDGFLTITGRKKDIIITAGGKNLTPANIEHDLQRSQFISHAVMHGDRRPFPVALITLDPEEIVPWARERGLPTELPVLAARPEVHELVQLALDTANRNYAPPEQIRRFALLGTEFSPETGELTPTLKIRRTVVGAKYRAELDALYLDQG